MSSRAFALRHGLPGMVGTAFLAIGALGIGWLPPSSNLLAVPLVGFLRTSLAGSLAARGLVIIGLAMLLQAWLVLGDKDWGVQIDLVRGQVVSVTP